MQLTMITASKIGGASCGRSVDMTANKFFWAVAASVAAIVIGDMLRSKRGCSCGG